MPDLSFSELTFLNASKAQPESHVVLENKKSKRKAVDRDDELSRFFAPTGAPANKGRQGHTKENRRMQHDREHREELRHHEIQSSMKTSPAAAAGLPDRPFLGFGEPGPRPPSLLDTNETPCSIISSVPRTVDASTSHSTSYFTWSRSSVTETGFINRIPNHSTTVSPSKAEAPSRSKKKNVSTLSKITPQPSQGATAVGTARKLQAIKSKDPKYQMYGALENQPDENIVDSLSPRTIPVSEDERDELKSILARRSQEFDLRPLKDKDGGDKSSDVLKLKTRGPPVVMEGTEALTAVLDSWFEKHERRFVRLATARTDSPDQSQGHKEVQETPPGAEQSQNAPVENGKFIEMRPVQESREHPSESLSRLQAPKPSSSKKQQDDHGGHSPHISPQKSRDPQVENPMNVRQNAAKLQGAHDSPRTFETDHQGMPCDLNQFPKKIRSAEASVNPQMCPRVPTAPNTSNWHPQASAFSITEQWGLPQTLYGQHPAGGLDHEFPNRNFRNITLLYPEAPDMQRAYFPVEPNLNYSQTEYIKPCPHTVSFGGRYPNSNTESSELAVWRESAFVRDYEQHSQEAVMQKGFNDDQEMYHGDSHDGASSQHKEVQESYPENECIYSDRQLDYATPKHSHSSYKSPNYPFEDMAIIDGRSYDKGGPYLQEPFGCLRFTDTLRLRLRDPRSTKRLFRPREVPIASLDEMEVAIPADFWRPTLC